MRHQEHQALYHPAFKIAHVSIFDPDHACNETGEHLSACMLHSMYASQSAAHSEIPYSMLKVMSLLLLETHQYYPLPLNYSTQFFPSFVEGKWILFANYSLFGYHNLHSNHYENMIKHHSQIPNGHYPRISSEYQNPHLHSYQKKLNCHFPFSFL